MPRIESGHLLVVTRVG